MPKYPDRQALIRGSSDRYRDKVTAERVGQGLQHYGIQPGTGFSQNLRTGIQRVTGDWENQWFNRWVQGVQR